MNFFILGEFPELPENFRIPNYPRMRTSYEKTPPGGQTRNMELSKEGAQESRQNLKSIKNMA